MCTTAVYAIYKLKNECSNESGKVSILVEGGSCFALTLPGWTGSEDACRYLGDTRNSSEVVHGTQCCDCIWQEFLMNPK